MKVPRRTMLAAVPAEILEEGSDGLDAQVPDPTRKAVPDSRKRFVFPEVSDSL